MSDGTAAPIPPIPPIPPIRVLLVDDQPLVRAGLRVLMADSPDLAVVGEAGTGDEAVRLARELRPDVVVMDVRMPGMDGIEATRIVTAGPGAPRVLVLTTFDDDEYVYGALRSGASGFLVKDMALDDILAAIRVVAAGDALIAPGVTRRLIEEFAARPEPGPRPEPGTGPEPGSRPGPERDPRTLPGVTAREREVLALVGRGLSNGEIAERLHISAATAKAHVARLFTKLDARDRVQLVILAYEAGLAP
ncbi:response regulator transcription factor [Streptomyces sp. SJL17-1]|uniref:response regulator transcription factor n=1 Tax=Streptomyces sp. SJL17-1 TaxID=2967223 RepID=UPI00296669A6|nr:response regulator transcription factor [Streptomyces sp. SJL17-1]